MLLDTFALLPLQLYALGFSSAAVGTLLVIAMLPWLMVSEPRPAHNLRLWIAPVAVLIFTALRLPGGNVWDAVLDPWLWFALHPYVARALWRKLRR